MYFYSDRLRAVELSKETIRQLSYPTKNALRGWYRAIDTHENPIDFPLTSNRDLDAAKRLFRKMLKDEPLLSPGKIGTDGANTFLSTINALVDDGFLHPDPLHSVTKHLQQGIESDYFRGKEDYAEDRRLLSHQ